MSDETKEVARSILDVDVTAVGMAVGYLAGLALVTQMQDCQREESQLFYRCFKPLEEGRTEEQDLRILADYVADRPEKVSGEQLFRKAAELALHDEPASSYFDQAFEIRMGYRLFARTCRLVIGDLRIEQREEQGRQEAEARQKISIPKDDRAIELEDGMFDRDDVRVAANEAILQVPTTKSALSSETDDPDDEADEEPEGDDGDADEKVLDPDLQPDPDAPDDEADDDPEGGDGDADEKAPDPDPQPDPDDPDDEADDDLEGGDGDADEKATDPDPQPDPDAPLSIGERPVSHHGKPQRGGARKQKTTQ